MPPKSQKKKKPAYNAFYFFMIEYREREEARGRIYNSLAEVSTPAGREWEQMDTEARAPYEQQAKEAKKKAKDGDVKYTTTGERIDHVISREEEKARAKRKMEEHISSIIEKNVAPTAFVDKVFYVAHVNYYCEVVSQDRYYPAEIAAVRFSLRNGVDSEDVFHVICNTGEVNRGTIFEELPIGYRLMAETVAKESHQIPPPPHKPELESTTEIKRSFSQFIDFLRHDLDPNQPTPPVFVEEKNEVVAKNVFSWFLEEFGYDDHLIKIYSLPYLFYCLRNAAHKVSNPDDPQDAFAHHSLAAHELEKDVYDYVKGISCPYHSKSDAFPYCSLSKVVRLVYIICDFCCPDVDIDLVPGSHIPLTADIKRIQKRAEKKSASRVAVLPARPPSVASDVESIQSAMTNTNISETPSATPSTQRIPRVQSRLVGQESAFDMNDFPSLPGPGRGLMNNAGIPVNRAPHLPRGRGRGRILQK